MSYQPGDIFKEKYRIVELIGGGAMGEVYRAEHLTIHKPVAIKLMHNDVAASSESVARFMREAQVAAILDHPNICYVSDFDTTEQGDFYIVMELLNGETLKERLKRVGKFEPIEAVWIVHQLLSALQCAHENNLVHRDVKPDNVILINRNGRDDFVKLIDFGIAHNEKPNGDLKAITQAGQIYGTPQYLSPEQALGEPIDFRADLYACGIILYELIVGEPVFNGSNYIELLHKHISAAPPHLPDSIEMSSELDGVIQRLLQKVPEDRFPSAEAVIEALDAISLKMHPVSPEGMAAFASMAGGSLNRNIQSLAVSVSKLGDENNGQKLPDSNNSLQALIESSSRMLPVKPKKWYEYKKNRLLIILGLAVVLLSVLLVFLLMNFNALKNAEEQAAEEKKETVTADDIRDTLAQMENKVLEPVPFNYTESECRSAFDEVLSMDNTVRTASESCLLKHYDEAKESFDLVKEKYWDHPNFLRMYLIAVSHLKLNNEVAETVSQLLKLVPDAGCNPSVREAIYDLLDSKVTLDTMKDVLSHIDNPRAAESLAWLILYTPCNRNSMRFKALLDCFESYGNKGVPQFLSDAVRIWSPFKRKGKCDERKKMVDDLLVEGIKTYCMVEGEFVESEPVDKMPYVEMPPVENNPNQETFCSKCLQPWRELILLHEPAEAEDETLADLPEAEPIEKTAKNAKSKSSSKKSSSTKSSSKSSSKTKSGDSRKSKRSDGPSLKNVVDAFKF